MTFESCQPALDGNGVPQGESGLVWWWWVRQVNSIVTGSLDTFVVGRVEIIIMILWQSSKHDNENRISAYCET